MATVLVAIGGSVTLRYAGGSLARSQARRSAELASLAATQTAAAAPVVLYQDPLTARSTGWADNDHCFLSSDGLHVRNNYICYAPLGDVTNIEVSVQAKQVSGSTQSGYGIVVRRAAVGNFYAFEIDSTGYADVVECDTSANASTPECRSLTEFIQNAAIQSGLNTANTLDVKAVGSHFVFSVNGMVVLQIDDAAFQSGLVALEAGGSNEIVFNNLKITRAS